MAKEGGENVAYQGRKRAKINNILPINADSAFDTREARKVCLNYGVIPNIAENKRNRKVPKRGHKRLFNAAVYKWRFTNERSFA
jgi:hypothetical protein